MRKFIALFVLMLFGLNSYAELSFNANCVKAYEQIISLRLTAAKALIAQEKRSNPDNAVPYLLDNYIDYYTILCSDLKSDFERLKTNKSSRIERIEKESDTSPYYLFALAEINLQWSLLRSKYGEYVTAAVELNRANSLLQENNKRFPAFLPNKKGMGMINAVLGSLPTGLKRTLSTFGVQGNTTAGIKMLEGLIHTLPRSTYSHFYDESVFYWSLVQADMLHDRNSYDRGIQFAAQMEPNSLLKVFVKANLALKTGHTDDAIDYLADRPQNAGFVSYPALEYMLGLAKIRKLDLSAEKHFLAFVKSSRNSGFTKDAYLNLAWIRHLQNDAPGYRAFISHVKNSGTTDQEKDKQALKEASDAQPDKTLLRSRLLFDGGYFGRAWDLLSDQTATDFNSLRDRIEFNYRSARILDELQKDDQALKFYLATISLGKQERYYFAANAALMAGQIYERKRNRSQAQALYQTAISMKNHDYEDSIESKARAGLKRLNVD